jgi:hypothetical protein
LNTLQLWLHTVFEPGLEMVQYHDEGVRSRAGHPIETSLAFKSFLCLPATELTPTLGISCSQSKSSFKSNLLQSIDRVFSYLDFNELARRTIGAAAVEKNPIKAKLFFRLSDTLFGTPIGIGSTVDAVMWGRRTRHHGLSGAKGRCGRPANSLRSNSAGR